MLIRIAALAGIAFAGFKLFEKGREEGVFGDAHSSDDGRDTWDMIDDEDIPAA